MDKVLVVLASLTSANRIKKYMQLNFDVKVIVMQTPKDIQLEGCGYCVGLYHVVRKAELADDGHRENHGEPALVQALGDVVGRAADVGVLALDLEELGEGAFDEGVYGPEQGHDPHPEYGSRPAYDYCGRHSGQIAGTHARCQRYEEGLQAADFFRTMACRGLPGGGGAVCQQSEHLSDKAELRAFGPYSKIQTGGTEEYHQYCSHGIIDPVKKIR